jgi:excisionase family DNA binding protein
MSEPRLLTTTDFAALAGVGPSSVKRWAEQGVIPSLRTAGGHRRFDREEVERFLRRQHREEVAPQTEAGKPATADPWVASLLSCQGLQMDAFLLGARARVGSWPGVGERLAEAFADIGRGWRGGEISIAQEHHASEQLQRALARILAMMPSPPGAPICLLACVPGDEHVLGLALAELCLREAGWGAHWLGRNTPVDEIIRVVDAGMVDLVALSASAACTDPAPLEAVANQVAHACAGHGRECLLGGSGAWPLDPPAGARRVRTFQELQESAARAPGRPRR